MMFFLTNISWGQDYKHSLDNSLIQKSDTLYIFSETLSKLDLKTKRILHSDVEIKFPVNFELKDHIPFHLDDKIIFLSDESGLLYEYRNDSIIRIDESYDNKTNNGSLNLVYKNNLYRFGGYGYFEGTNLLMSYDNLESNQWDIVKYKGFEKVIPFSYVGFHFMVENKLHVFGFYSYINKFQNEINFNNNGFIYDFDNKIILDVFKVNPKIKKPQSYIDLNNEYVFLFYPDSQKILIIKKDDYSVSEYTMSLRQSHLSNKHHTKFAVHEDEIFYISNDVDGKIYIRSMDFKSIIENSSPLNISIFSDNILIFRILLVIGFFLFITFVFILIRNKNKNKNKLHINGPVLFINKTPILEDEKSVKIIRNLINNPYLTNSELNNYFSSNGLNLNHINREKNKFINHLNIKLSSYLDQDFITREKDKYDKRMIVFKINKDLFRKQI